MSKSPILSSFLFVLVIFHLVMINGCASQNLKVVPFRSHNVASLSAEDVVAVMRRARFPDEQIEQLGTELRNALAVYGACRVNSDGRTEALFLIEGDFVYVIVQGLGNFFYKIKNPDQLSLPEIMSGHIGPRR